MTRLTAFALAFSLSTLAMAGAAVAQGAPTPREACRSSVMTLCPAEMKAMDRSAIKACLIKNFDKATPECQTALKAAAAAKASAAPGAH